MTSTYFDTKAINTFKEFVLEAKSDNKNIVILCDKNTKKYCFPLLNNYISFPFIDLIISIPDGEEHKNIETITYIWKQLLENNIDKNTVLISLGGGVVCDLGGFVAATFKRGIESVYIPTSLIAQVDASIGGKTGFNLENTKNQIGIFNYPEYNFIIPQFLNSLSEKEIWSGFAEMLKHGLIADKAYWEKLIQIQSYSEIINPELIKKSIEIKTSICETDPFEKNERKKLNFGHTIGHALEALSMETNQPLSHGEAVGIGIIAESYISFQKNLINSREFFTISETLFRFNRISIPQKINHDSFMYYLNKDKKKIGQDINFTLLNSIGNAIINQQVTYSEIISALDFLSEINNSK
jgi:3-dehydroquinate synthase